MRRLTTNREIEIKVRIDDLAATVEALLRLGAKCQGRVFESNTLYDTAAGDFLRSGRLLRLRVESPAGSGLLPAGPNRAGLTSKTPVPGSRLRYKEKYERELIVRGASEWPAMLRSIGFHAGFRYEKYRSTFRLGSLHLDLDETPAGVFLELEGAARDIDRAAKALGFSQRDYIRATYWDLFQADRKRRRRKTVNMLFANRKFAK